MCASVGWDGHSLSHPLGVNFTIFFYFDFIFFASYDYHIITVVINFGDILILLSL